MCSEQLLVPGTRLRNGVPMWLPYKCCLCEVPASGARGARSRDRGSAGGHGHGTSEYLQAVQKWMAGEILHVQVRAGCGKVAQIPYLLSVLCIMYFSFKIFTVFLNIT